MKNNYVTVHALTHDIQFLVDVFEECRNDKGVLIDPEMRQHYTTQNLNELKNELETINKLKPAFRVVRNQNTISGISVFFKPETVREDIIRWLKRVDKQIPVLVASVQEDKIELDFIGESKVLTSYIDADNLEKNGLKAQRADVSVVKSYFFENADDINEMFGKPVQDQVAYLMDYLNLPLCLTMEEVEKYPKENKSKLTDTINVKEMKELVEHWSKQIDTWARLQDSMDDTTRANFELWKNGKLLESVIEADEECEEDDAHLSLEHDATVVDEDEFVNMFLHLVRFCVEHGENIKPGDIRFQIEDRIIQPYVVRDGIKESIEFYDYIDFTFPEEDEMRLEVEDNMFYVNVNRCIAKIREEYEKYIVNN